MEVWTYYVCLFCTQRTLSHSTHIHNVKLYSKRYYLLLQINNNYYNNNRNIPQQNKTKHSRFFYLRLKLFSRSPPCLAWAARQVN